MRGVLNYKNTIVCVVCNQEKEPKEFNIRPISENVRAYSDTCEKCVRNKNNRKRERYDIF